MRRGFSTCSASSFQAHRSLWTLRQSLTNDHESAVRVDRLETSFCLRKRFVYKRPARGLWCMHERNCAPPKPKLNTKTNQFYGLVKYALLDDSAQSIQLSRRSFDHHLDNDSVDASGVRWRAFQSGMKNSVALESGGELPSSRQSWRKMRRRSAACRPRELAQVPGRKMERLNFQAPVSRPQSSGVLARLRDHGHRHRA